MCDDLGAQEEDLNRAIRDQNRRTAGLTALASRLKNMVYQYLPGGGESDSEAEAKAREAAAVLANAAKVEVREVKLVLSDGSGSSASPDVEGASTDAVTQAAQQADMEAEVYRQSLQAATTKLRIQGSFPKSKQIMVGAKNLGIGDQIAIQYQEHLFELEILDVTSSELKLKDQKSQLELDVAIGVTRALPPGMFKSRPPGMFPTEPKPVEEGR